MTPICCALIVRGTSSFLPIVRACANKVRSLSPLQRASAKPSISANNTGRLWTKAASLCRSALRLAIDLPAAVFGQGHRRAVRDPGPRPNAGSGFDASGPDSYGLSGTAQSDILRMFWGRRTERAQWGIFNDDRRSSTHFAGCVGGWLIEPGGFARKLGQAGC